MNEEVLQRLANAIANETILRNWPFYVILATLTFSGALLGSYFRARSAKRGEVAATRADAEQIISHLRKTTEATKAVELSLSRNDWLQRERNVLERAKLEQLITAAISLASWTKAAVESAIAGKDHKDPPSLDEFKMLALLYFPELKEETMNVVILLHEAILVMLPFTHDLQAMQKEWENPMSAQDTAQLEELIVRRAQFHDEHRDAVFSSAIKVEKAVLALSDSAPK